MRINPNRKKTDPKSNILSITIVAKDEITLILSFLLIMYALTISPSLAGKRLLAIKPIIITEKRECKSIFFKGHKKYCHLKALIIKLKIIKKTIGIKNHKLTLFKTSVVPLQFFTSRNISHTINTVINKPIHNFNFIYLFNILSKAFIAFSTLSCISKNLSAPTILIISHTFSSTPANFKSPPFSCVILQ